MKVNVYMELNNSGRELYLVSGSKAKMITNGIREDGVDIYADNAPELIKDYFDKMSAGGDLNRFDDIWSPNEYEFSAIKADADKGDIELVLVTSYKE